MRVRLIHWNSAEAEACVVTLRKAGFEVDYAEKFDSAVFRAVKQSPPDAFVIDLSRLPSHGREIATALRGARPTRRTPILFVDGEPEKVEKVRTQLPDAIYTDTKHLRSAVRDALARTGEAPLVPVQMMDRYKERTPAQKLGIKENSTVALIEPPVDYGRVIGSLPSGAELREDSPQAGDVTLWFLHDPESLEPELRRIRAMASMTKLWLLWQKQRAGRKAGLTQFQVRECCNAVGLVDYKICSVNDTWSAMAFAPRKAHARGK
ncbi:MAG TPA: hypothetical protein VKU01_16925 [Bryobacteraceae bacterium]|nr:hypothetical protein [Bryobacteraceae bacterium]